MEKTKYSLSTIRKKAYAAGYRVEKGFQRYRYNNAVCRDCNGVAYTGYEVQDLTTGYYEWGSYDENFTHLWNLEDVEEFLKSVYEKAGLEY